jgi:phage shock protein PspC (stress-responsive transcriptional regulator)
VEPSGDPASPSEPNTGAVHEPAAEPAVEPTAEVPPPLRRVPEGSVIAGVCTGLGRSLGIDPVILRVAFVLLALASGVGILLYLILAAVMPKERPGEEAPPADRSRLAALRRITGWALLGLGGVLLIGRFVPGVDQVVWPVALLALGAAVLVQSARD